MTVPLLPAYAPEIISIASGARLSSEFRNGFHTAEDLPRVTTKVPNPWPTSVAISHPLPGLRSAQIQQSQRYKNIEFLTLTFASNGRPVRRCVSRATQRGDTLNPTWTVPLSGALPGVKFAYLRFCPTQSGNPFTFRWSTRRPVAPIAVTTAQLRLLVSVLSVCRPLSDCKSQPVGAVPVDPDDVDVLVPQVAEVMRLWQRFLDA